MQIDGSFESVESGEDVIFTVGKDSILLVNAAMYFKPKTVYYDDTSPSKVTLASKVEIGDATARTLAIRINGNTLDNTILGGSGNDTLYGKDGNDYLEGNNGADKLYGQAGDDTLLGSAGNDTLTGGDGSDIFLYNSGDGKDIINDFSENDTLQIGDGSDTYAARIGGNNIIVMAGDGLIILKDAAKLSTLNILGEESIPASTYDDSSAVRITLDLGIVIGDATARTLAIRINGNALDNTILGGNDKDTLYGKDGNDYLEGGDGSDKLYGQAGDDTLWGGGGNDTLWGDAGADTFFYNAGEGRDVISGFGDDDLLQITDGFTTSYNGSKRTVTFKFDDGTLTLKDFTATTFNVNGTGYHISGKTLVK